MEGSLVKFKKDTLNILKRLLGSSSKPRSPQVPFQAFGSADEDVWLLVNTVNDSDPVTCKAEQVWPDGETTHGGAEIRGRLLFDSDASGEDDDVIVLDDIEILPNATGDIEEDKVYKLVTLINNATGEPTYYIEPKGGGSSSFLLVDVLSVTSEEDGEFSCNVLGEPGGPVLFPAVTGKLLFGVVSNPDALTDQLRPVVATKVVGEGEEAETIYYFDAPVII